MAGCFDFCQIDWERVGMASSDLFTNMRFSDFQRLASDENLSKYERIGFPDSYRKGFEEIIFADIRSKLTNLDSTKKNILDIGPGCSDLPVMLINLCDKHEHQLTLVDGKEMLDLLPHSRFITKVVGMYPNCDELLGKKGCFDAILCYSVLHYVMLDTAFFKFLDTSLSLLAPGGQMLIGDIPNISKRKRFFSSETGIRYHQNFMKTNELPKVDFNIVEHNQIDDAVVMSLIQRARAQGFDAYIIPQNAALPMANRREDILIVRP